MTDSDTVPETLDLPAKKSKTRRSRADEPSTSSNPQTEAKPERKSKKRLHDDKTDTNEGDSTQTSAKGKKMKKRKREAEASDNEGGEKDEDKKAKKKSKLSKEIGPDVATTPVVSTKKRKNKTGFPNPNEDTSLSGQTQKCLAYAFLQFHRPSKWKFNKARQNWLIRNIWTNETIPEVYLPLALGYLAKVEGGVREKLLQTCRTALESPKIEVVAAPDNPAPTEALAPSESESVRKARALALVDLLSPLETGSS